MTEPLLRVAFSLVLNGLLCFLAIRFLNRLVGKRIVTDKVFYAVCIAGVVLLTAVNRINTTSFNIDLTAGAAVILFLAFLYTGRIWVKLMFGVLFTVLAGVSQIITVMLSSIVTGQSLFELYEVPFAFIGITIFSVVLLWSLSEIVVKIQKNRESEIPANVSIFLLTIPIASLVMLVIIFSWYLENGSYTNSSLAMSLSALVGILYINFVVFYMFDQISGLMKERREKELLQRQVDMQSKHYQQLEEYQKEVRHIRHDMKNNLHTLNQIISEYGAEQAQDYLASLIDAVSHVPRVIDTGNPGIDTVLNIKLEEARRQKIALSTDIVIAQGLKLSFEESAVLFGNLLDNAIEACALLNEKHISIKMNTVNDALYLSVINPAKSNGLKTNKPDKLNHGIGLKSVAMLVSKFGGMMKTEQEEGMFSVKLVLYKL